MTIFGLIAIVVLAIVINTVLQIPNPWKLIINVVIAVVLLFAILSIAGVAPSLGTRIS